MLGGLHGRHICRPYKPTRKFFISIRSRAGLAPPLPRDGFLSPRRGNGQPSQISPSSVTCGDSFPQKGEAFRGVYPLGCLVGRIATGGIYAAPTNQPASFSFSFGRGRGLSRPYRAMVFYRPAGEMDNHRKFPLHPSPAVTAFPKKGEAFRGVYPVGCLVGRIATGGIYAAPTNQPASFSFPFGRGRGLPRPYRVVNFN